MFEKLASDMLVSIEQCKPGMRATKNKWLASGDCHRIGENTPKREMRNQSCQNDELDDSAEIDIFLLLLTTLNHYCGICVRERYGGS